MKKRMKISAFALSAVLLFSGTLCGCSRLYPWKTKPSKDAFFAQKVLDNALVPDLPRIVCEAGVKEYGKIYHFRTSQEDYQNYLETVYQYLGSRGFAYFGYEGEEISSFFGAMPKYELLADRGQLSDYQTGFGGSYIFVWGNKIDEEGNLLDGKRIDIRYSDTYFTFHELECYVTIDLGFAIVSHCVIQEEPSE